jgi:hypothetical protein
MEKKFRSAELPWLSTSTSHFIGKYYCKGEYRVHRVYNHSNLKPYFVAQHCDQVESYISYNHVLLRSPCFVINKQVKFQEGE